MPACNRGRKTAAVKYTAETLLGGIEWSALLEPKGIAELKHISTAAKHGCHFKAFQTIKQPGVWKRFSPIYSRFERVRPF